MISQPEHVNEHGLNLDGQITDIMRPVAHNVEEMIHHLSTVQWKRKFSLYRSLGMLNRTVVVTHKHPVSQ